MWRTRSSRISTRRDRKERYGSRWTRAPVSTPCEHTFDIKNRTPADATVVIESLLPDPVGEDRELEEVTIRNDGPGTADLAQWYLQDLALRRWPLSDLGRLPSGATGTTQRRGLPLNLNNTGDTIVLVDPAGQIRDRFGYDASTEGTRIVTGTRRRTRHGLPRPTGGPSLGEPEQQSTPQRQGAGRLRRGLDSRPRRRREPHDPRRLHHRVRPRGDRRRRRRFGEPPSVRGRPLPAMGELGQKIVRVVIERSAHFGTLVEERDGTAVVRIEPEAMGPGSSR